MMETPSFGTTMRAAAVTNQLAGFNNAMPPIFHVGDADDSTAVRVYRHEIDRMLNLNQAKLNSQTKEPEEKTMAETTTRIVTVYLVDPNPNLPVERRLLYKSDEGFPTELTDQELFFDIDVAGLLKKHNEFRVTVEDKKASASKEKPVMLEPVRIRDLKMQVVVLAQF